MRPPPPAPIKGGPASISSEYTKEGHFLPREGTYAPHSDLLKRAFSPSGDQMLYFINIIKARDAQNLNRGSAMRSLITLVYLSFNRS